MVVNVGEIPSVDVAVVNVSIVRSCVVIVTVLVRTVVVEKSVVVVVLVSAWTRSARDMSRRSWTSCAAGALTARSLIVMICLAQATRALFLENVGPGMRSTRRSSAEEHRKRRNRILRHFVGVHSECVSPRWLIALSHIHALACALSIKSVWR